MFIKTSLLFGLLATVSTVVCAQTAKDTAGNQEAQSKAHENLASNKCLQQLADHELVIASIAFKDGLTGYKQAKELVSRRPWGAIPSDTVEEIKKQLDTQSPFLIVTLSKKQALTLDDHRDIIRWVLVQSTSKACE